MKRKILLFLAIALLCSGCTVKYGLHVNYDGTLTENIEVYESDENFVRVGSTAKEYVDVNNEIFEKNGIYANYERKIDYINDGVRITSERKYIPFKDFNYSSAAKNSMFKTFTFEEDEENKALTFNATDFDSGFFVVSDHFPVLEYDKIEFTVTSDLKVIYNNADTVNEETGEYTWVFEAGKDPKDIQISFSTKRDIIGWIKFYLVRYQWYFIIGGVIVVAIALISVIIKQRYKAINKV